MACCGGRRARLSILSGATRRAVAWPKVTVEYVGAGQLTATGAATGALYHFTANGARQAVDARDVTRLLLHRELRRV